MVLVNAIALDAPWEFPFDPEATRDESVHPAGRHDGRRADDALRRVPADRRTSDTYQAVELPYGGGALSMVVIVPTDLAAYEAALTRRVARRGPSDRSRTAASTSRCRAGRARTHLTLNDTLTCSGCRPRSATGADFSGMVEGGGLWLDRVEHEAFVEVDEDGTRAAAATAARWSARTARRSRRTGRSSTSSVTAAPARSSSSDESTDPSEHTPEVRMHRGRSLRARDHGSATGTRSGWRTAMTALMSAKSDQRLAGPPGRASEPARHPLARSSTGSFRRARDRAPAPAQTTASAARTQTEREQRLAPRARDVDLACEASDQRQREATAQHLASDRVVGERNSFRSSRRRPRTRPARAARG